MLNRAVKVLTKFITNIQEMDSCVLAVENSK